MIWLLGAQGMLGGELAALMQKRSLPFVPSGREVDITDPSALRAFSSGRKCSLILNTAAYTHVDKAEEEEALAARVNGEGPANLARLARELGVPVIHLSTDYVFSGEQKTPIKEDESPGPLNAYGRTKLAGEEALRRIHPGHIILRTSWLYGSRGPSFVHTMLSLLARKEEVSVVNDQVSRPTETGELARVLLSLAMAKTKRWGTYHYAGEGETSWFDFAREIRSQALAAGLFKAPPGRLRPISSQDYAAPAPRPRYSVMDTSKIQRDYALRPAPWQQTLEKFLREDYPGWKEVRG